MRARKHLLGAAMSDHHYVQLVVEGGGLMHRFVCTAPDDAACRRRPDDFEDGARESWTAEEAVNTGYPCWAADWVDAIGVDDAVLITPEGVLASVPVDIHYDEGVTARVATVPSGGQVAAARKAIHRALAPNWMSIASALGGSQVEYDAFLNEVAVAALSAKAVETAEQSRSRAMCPQHGTIRRPQPNYCLCESAARQNEVES